MIWEKKFCTAIHRKQHYNKTNTCTHDVCEDTHTHTHAYACSRTYIHYPLVPTRAVKVQCPVKPYKAKERAPANEMALAPPKMGGFRFIKSRSHLSNTRQRHNKVVYGKHHTTSSLRIEPEVSHISTQLP